MVRAYSFVFIFLLFSAQGWAASAYLDGDSDPDAREKNHAFLGFLMEYLDIKYQLESPEEVLYVSIRNQKLFHVVDSQVVHSYDVSTSAKGLGTRYGSNRTPPGLHVVKSRIGQGAPIGAIFRERRMTGDTAKILKDSVNVEEDAVTTRILWLSGMEEGVNKGGKNDSYQRYIYIHGTPEEGLIGTPASHGCIRMRNQEVVELFKVVEEGTYVVILDN